MSTSLSEELASLKIDRRNQSLGPVQRRNPGRKSSGGGFGLRILSFFLWMIPLGLLGGGGYYAYGQYRQIRAKPIVSLGKVEMLTLGEVTKLFMAEGHLKSRSQSAIGAKVAGRVQELFVEEGSRVKRGQVMVVLEHNDLDAQLESRKATLQRGLADIEEARADLEYKRSKADRARRLQNKNMSVSAEEMQQASSAVDMGAAHLASLEATAKYQQAQVREVEESLVNMRIVAPFDGTVVERPADLGEMISGGTVLTLANLEQMDVEADVVESLLWRIAVGWPAEVEVKAVPGKRYRARVRRINPMGDRASGNVKVKVEILDPDDKLFPELQAKVYFLPVKSEENPDANRADLFLPTSTIFKDGDRSYVWVVDDREMIHKTAVEVVVVNQDHARVSSGVKAGDRLIRNPVAGLIEGEAVKVGD